MMARTREIRRFRRRRSRLEWLIGYHWSNESMADAMEMYDCSKHHAREALRLTQALNRKFMDLLNFELYEDD